MCIRDRKLDYAGKEGWSANATLEGGPNLSYVKSQRTESISGAGSQRFNIDDGQSGGGFNSLATMGVKSVSYTHLDVYKRQGELDVSGGGHGIDITGDSATVDNKGGMTVTDPDSIGIQIDGDKAVVNNDGGSAISNGGTGTQINGDEATVNNNGNTTVDGQGSTGTEIAGNLSLIHI